MDTSVLEYTAEDLVAHRLGRAGLLVAKPRCDQNGGDLLAMMQVRDGALFCRIQCKGRTLRQSGSTEVTVPCDYVTLGFVLFLYVETSDPTETNLFCFFETDIKHGWGQREDKFVFTLNGRTTLDELAMYAATDTRIQLIKSIIPTTDAAQEFKRLVFATFAFQEEGDDVVSITAIVESEASSVQNETPSALPR